MESVSVSTSSCCFCPFCKSSRPVPMLSRGKWNFNSKISWSACLVILLLLLGSCEAYHLHGPRQKRAQVGNSSIATYSQKLSIKPSEQQQACSAMGKCRPCSWLDMNRKLPECLTFGFKQRSYCSDIKRERYVSCHYVPDAREARLFWLVEGSVCSIGILAYAVVILRNRKIERRTARRIQEQINA